jgi:hypothetical protein
VQGIIASFAESFSGRFYSSLELVAGADEWCSEDGLWIAVNLLGMAKREKMIPESARTS